MEKRTIPEICQELRKLADRTEECHCYDLRNLSTDYLRVTADLIEDALSASANNDSGSRTFPKTNWEDQDNPPYVEGLFGDAKGDDDAR